MCESRRVSFLKDLPHPVNLHLCSLWSHMITSSLGASLAMEGRGVEGWGEEGRGGEGRGGERRGGEGREGEGRGGERGGKYG